MTTTEEPTTEVDTRKVAEEVAAAHGLVLGPPAGTGVDFAVYRVTHPQEGQAVLRVPKHRAYVSPYGDVDSADLVRQEHEIAHWLGDRGLPVARPLELMEHDGLLVSTALHVEHDDAPLDGRDIGRFLGALHSVQPPPLTPAYQAPGAFAPFFAERLRSRCAHLRERDPALPALPQDRELLRTLESATEHVEPRLLHLDVRRQNLLGRRGRVAAVVDWSNALLGPPLMELARVAEYALLPDNGLDADAVLAGYAEHAALPDLDSPAALVFRLDTAVMLALVFHAVAPDPGRAAELTARSVHLADRLNGAHAR